MRDDFQYAPLNGSLLTILDRRPRHCPIPHDWNSVLAIHMWGLIDYGTWRDLQRHRRNVGAAPELTPMFGFHPWYMEQLSRYTGSQFVEKVDVQTRELFAYLKTAWRKPHSTELAYHIPLGAQVEYDYTMGLSQSVYFAELRSGQTVHAILRPIAQEVGRVLTHFGVRVDCDIEDARFDVRRGQQTISERPENVNG